MADLSSLAERVRTTEAGELWTGDGIERRESETITQTESSLLIDNIRQYYGESLTLRDVSLDVQRSECTVLMGRNGVGKTTLLEVIMGLLPIAQGDIRLDTMSVASLSTEARVAAGIGYVPQGRRIFPLLSVQENLAVGLAARQDRSRRVPEHVYELFPVLHEMRNRRGGDLSGGQQQQLAIGRALVTDPSVLLLDEPTEGIQPNIVAAIGDAISTLIANFGLTVLLVEQKLPFARRVGQRFALMDRGGIVATGAIDALDDSLVSRYLAV